MPDFEIDFSWVHIRYEEASPVAESYGFAGTQGAINLEGILMRPRGRPSSTLLIFMHPASTLHLLPLTRAAAAAGAHVLCAASRYMKNDTALIMEKVLLDLGAYIRHAKKVLGYDRIVLMGWSGGGSLALFYQSQAEQPTIETTPAGDPVDVKGAGLIPADAIILQAAHISRARLLLDNIDPSVIDEAEPDRRMREYDLYDLANPNQPPYADAFVTEYRQRQRARIDRIRAFVLETLDGLKSRAGRETERSFVTHRTFADPRFVDPTLDPNGRKPRSSYIGDPETANTAAIALGRFSTLRSWLSQWSIEDTRADGMACASRVTAPMLIIEHGADDGVPQPHARLLFAASASSDKTFHLLANATHYLASQPRQLAEAVELHRSWLATRNLLG